MYVIIFFFNDTATTEIYTLSLHDALPIFHALEGALEEGQDGHHHEEYSHASSAHVVVSLLLLTSSKDRKSTRLNSSHANISYAVFCLKKKKKNISYA